MERRAFSFYKSYYDMACELTDSQFAELMREVLAVEFFDKHIDSVVFDDKLLSMAWASMKQSIKMQIDGYCTKKAIIYNDIDTLAKGVSKGLQEGLANKGKGKGKNKDKGKDNTVSRAIPDDVRRILEYLNMTAGKKYLVAGKANIEIVTARLNDGYEVECFFEAIDNQCTEWLGSNMEKYLRPETLFRKSKFDGYVNNNNATPEHLKNLSKSEQTILTLHGGNCNGLDGRGNTSRIHTAIEFKAKEPTSSERDPYNLRGVGEVVEAEYQRTDRRN